MKDGYADSSQTIRLGLCHVLTLQIGVVYVAH